MSEAPRESISPAELRGRAAVITGGANGIGLATAKRLADLGMKLCLVDWNEEALKQARNGLLPLVSDEADVVTGVVDVSDYAQVEAFRDAVYERFGEVALLMNNAGIDGGEMKPWDGPERWRRVMEVNFFGVTNGVGAFTERMIGQGTPAAIVNTGSKEGITTPPGNAAYSASKAGVKVLTEQLAYELRQIENCRVSAHLLVPGWTFTAINTEDFENAEKPDGAWTADRVAEFLLENLEAGNFYILCPDNSVTREMDERRVAWAAGDLVENRPALSRWHPDHATAFERSMEGVKRP
ncbi:SDR family NAD(P)-dependent oxidoreductase [Rubrobacter indicoceani]|uniref:SDR family NAD(P)-dependent oxidoreductase n=1 Tax=Rubrobacter indicoceani TaxID=2051957 RepID=UPI000E5ACD34|nr:SDR family NAD(P)-dependent oxidoreductase [Rubrobacter indicoceani]